MKDGKLVKKRTVIVTEDGNKLVEAGDIITQDIAAAKEIEMLRKSPKLIPEGDGVAWKGGKPLDVIVDGIKKRVSHTRLNKSFGDMDMVLPADILARRKQLVLDRLKQERLR